MATYLGDALVILSLLSVTGAIVGQARARHIYGRIRAAGQSVFLAILPLVLVLLTQGDASLAAGGLLLIGFLLLTTAVASHVIGHVAFVRGRESAEGARERERERA
jgi:multisubunit Na+/H+ antiporter MnhG subunit